ncbi:hypothetical protein [Paraclostridium dentum]
MAVPIAIENKSVLLQLFTGYLSQIAIPLSSELAFEILSIPNDK